MWMLGYNEGGDHYNNTNAGSFNGVRKLRPLIPRPSNSFTTSSINNASPVSSLGRFHGADHLFTSNHHFSAVSEQSKKDIHHQFNSTQPVLGSSRWNPTPEQLRTLEDLYRRGTRTPSADQIQHITAQLRRYGKIEGKNVFYWFQNHKARERQKRRRRQLESGEPDDRYSHSENNNYSEGSRTGLEHWAPPTNCSTLAEDSASPLMEREERAEGRADGWIQFDERELQHRRSPLEKNATWHMTQLTCPLHHTHLINTTITATKPTGQELPVNSINDHENRPTSEELGCSESQTLQLFPLSSGDDDESPNADYNQKKAELTLPEINTINFGSYQFFEFLPLKN